MKQVRNNINKMNAIVLNNVSKKYTLTKERPLLLKNLFVPSKKEEMWALKDVSLEIKKGETIGIIGENGSGKSTLLKIISGITTSTTGKVEVNGRVASLIELGAGFHPDLTGRENVYLNGTLLGLTKKEIDKKYKEIVEFADIGEFIDQPVRTYSSGMTVRLGFSVAVHLDPDILLIDEVLAVGDEEFQRKCIEKINKFKKDNKTIILVSHNLSLISNITSRVYIFIKGKNVKSGFPKNLIKFYQQYIINKEKKIKNRKHKGEIIKDVKFYNKYNKEEKLFESNKPFKVKIFYHIKQQINNPVIGIAIHNEDGSIILGPNTYASNIKISLLKGKGNIDCSIFRLPLLPGRYKCTVAIYNSTCTIPLEYQNQKYKFLVIGDKKHKSGVIDIPVYWKIHES